MNDMKFTIERRPLIRMIQHVRRRDPSQRNSDGEVKLSACAARVFVANARMVAGHEALVFQEGECFIPGKRLIKFLRSFGRKKNLTLEIDEKGLRAGTFTSAVRAYSPITYPPGKFETFPVTDLNVVREHPKSTRDEVTHILPLTRTDSNQDQLSRSNAVQSAKALKSSGWYSGCDLEVDAAWIRSLQLTFFLRRPRELCEHFNLDWSIACQLYDDGFLSFDPRGDHELNEAQEAEFLLVGSIAAAGYDRIGLARILHGLNWPYQYRPGRIYLDWITRRWRLVPTFEKIDAWSVFYAWLQSLAEEGDTAAIEELSEQVTQALKSAREEKAE